MSLVRYDLHLFTNKTSTARFLERCGSRLKTETENGVFCYGSENAFLYKTENDTVFSDETNRGNGRSRNGRARYGTVKLTNSDSLLYLYTCKNEFYFIKQNFGINFFLKN
jgi:hypothetical protein